MLESLITPKVAEKKPFGMLILGIIYSSIGILLSITIFPNTSSLTMVFLTTLACVPLIVRMLKIDELEIPALVRLLMQDYEKKKRKKFFLIGEHIDVFKVMLFLFLGFLISFTLWYVFLPNGVYDKVFQMQIGTISKISGNVSAEEAFPIILTNNLKVLFFCFFFSFLYGAGAIYIISWNASVFGAAIGNLIREKISSFATTTHLETISAYFHVFPIGFSRYLLHGIFEISAFFLGGIAGGIISAAVIREHYKDKEKFKSVLLSSLKLILTASLLILIGAIIEVSISPLIK